MELRTKARGDGEAGSKKLESGRMGGFYVTSEARAAGGLIHRQFFFLHCAKHDVRTMYFTPNMALFLRHDPHPIPLATPRATNSSDLPRSAPQQLSIVPVRSGTWQHKFPLFAQLAAHAHRRSRTTLIEMNAFGSPTRRLVRHLHHAGEQRQVNDLQQPARKIEPRGVHRILR